MSTILILITGMSFVSSLFNSDENRFLVATYIPVPLIKSYHTATFPIQIYEKLLELVLTGYIGIS